MAPLVPTGPGPMEQEQAGSLTGQRAGWELMTASFTPEKLPVLSPSGVTRVTPRLAHKGKATVGTLALCLWLSLIRQTVCTVRSKGVVLVEADSTDHWSSPRWRTGGWAGICSRLSSLSIHRRNPVCRSPPPLNTRPASSKTRFDLEVCASPPQEWPGLGHRQRGGC